MIELKLDKALKDSNIDYAILASCDQIYFDQYGLDLIKSHQDKSRTVPLIINCINFNIKEARDTIKQELEPRHADNIFLVKCTIPHLKSQNEEIKLCWYKTTRYEVARILQKTLNIELAVIDVDALFIKNASCIFAHLKGLEIDFCIGSRFDFEEGNLFDSSFVDYPWRIIKAGFSYFSASKIGRIALESVSSKLFNFKDKVQPSELLKLYRFYYGDQIALLFTYLEIKSVPSKFKPRLLCLGFQEKGFLSFSDLNQECVLWIPVKRARR